MLLLLTPFLVVLGQVYADSAEAHLLEKIILEANPNTCERTRRVCTVTAAGDAEKCGAPSRIFAQRLEGLFAGQP